MKHALKTLSSVFAAGLLMTGCANQSKPLYHWGSYQPQVYEYFKGDGSSTEAQIIALEAEMEKARAGDAKLPPGYHAQPCFTAKWAVWIKQSRSSSWKKRSIPSLLRSSIT